MPWKCLDVLPLSDCPCSWLALVPYLSPPPHNSSPARPVGIGLPIYLKGTPSCKGIGQGTVSITLGTLSDLSLPDLAGNQSLLFCLQEGQQQGVCSAHACQEEHPIDGAGRGEWEAKDAAPGGPAAA